MLRPTFLIMSIKIVHLSISLALYLLKFLVLVEAEVEMNKINTLQNISCLNVIVIKFYNINTFVLFTLGNTMLETSKKSNSFGKTVTFLLVSKCSLGKILFFIHSMPNVWLFLPVVKCSLYPLLLKKVGLSFGIPQKIGVSQGWLKDFHLRK